VIKFAAMGTNGRDDGRPDAGSVGQLIVSVDSGVGWIVVDNPPKRNAMTSAMFATLGEVCRSWSVDPAVRAVVIRGHGDVAFISGGDIGQLRAERALDQRPDGVPVPAGAVLGALDKPVIAMINGYCLGGGIAVAVAADIRLCSDDAHFGVPAARLGLGYPYEDTARLVALVGPGQASEILFGGQRIDAARAERIGLVNRVVAKAELEDAARQLALTIAANAPLSHVAHKRSIRAAVGAQGPLDRAEIDKSIAAAWRSDDFIEGRQAFLDRREPVFGGR